MPDTDPNLVEIGPYLKKTVFRRTESGASYVNGWPITREQLERLDGWIGLSLGFAIKEDDDGPAAA